MLNAAVTDFGALLLPFACVCLLVALRLGGAEPTCTHLQLIQSSSAPSPAQLKRPVHSPTPLQFVFWPSSVTLWLLKAVFLDLCLLCLCELAASPSFPCSSSPLPPTLPNLVSRTLQSRVSDPCCLQPSVPPPCLPTLLQCLTSSKSCTKFCCFLFSKRILLF